MACGGRKNTPGDPCCSNCGGFSCSSGPLAITAVEAIATGGTSPDCTCPTGGTFLMDTVQRGVNCSSCSPIAETTCGPITILEDECVISGRNDTLPADFNGPCVSSYSYYLYTSETCCNWRIYDDFTFKQFACAQISGLPSNHVSLSYHLTIQRDRKIIESRKTARYRRLVVVTNSGPAPGFHIFADLSIRGAAFGSLIQLIHGYRMPRGSRHALFRTDDPAYLGLRTRRDTCFASGELCRCIGVSNGR